MRLLTGAPRSHRIVFFGAVLLALGFALYTQHVWEDYYITYRSSRNLATGNGLVYNVGDRLHTFTSPLGVLLPAVATVLTLNHSDTAALWLFRLMSITAFAAASVLAYACFRQTQRHALAAAMAALWLMLDAKSLDFTINGMETGFLLCFLMVTLQAQFGAVSRRAVWLGLGWAGLMWTRPDGFIFIGLMAAGAWLFNEPGLTGYTRREWLKTCMIAGLICGAVYLPWFLGAWWYYGTPVPHTIVAKSMLTAGHHSLAGLLEVIVKLPVRVWTTDTTSLPGAFLPAYYMMGGWPAGLVVLTKFFAVVAAFAWLVPGLGAPVRTASFGFFGFQVYLTYFPYFPFPWYQPGTTWLAGYALWGVVARLWGGGPNRQGLWRLAGALGWTLAGLMLGMQLWTTPAVARQVAAQQRSIEDHHRRRIGEWLHNQGRPGDTVFLEPLGYIGYFSNLKMYDFPGMSSREMPRAISYLGQDWVLLIEETTPTWLVLRPNEVERITKNRPSLLSAYYHPAQTFDVMADVEKLDVRGHRWLEVDARFQVFRRENFNTYETKLGVAHSLFPPGLQQLDGRPMVMIHAPSDVVMKVPASAHSLAVACGYVAGAGQGEPKSDGASFNVKLRDQGHTILLGWRYINPADGPDPHTHVFELALPAHTPDAELILQADPGASSVKDWTCWSAPEFK